MNSLDYGKIMCDNLMEMYPPQAIPPNIGWFTYIHGVFLSGMERIYKLTGEKKYFQYIKDWVDSVTTPDGKINPCENMWCSLNTLDYRQPGILLFNLYNETGEERYRKVIEYLTESLKEYPVNSKGGFWHMTYQPHQMWLDGLYMAGPLMAMYGAQFNKPEFFDMAASQAIIMFDNMRDKKTGLLRHGWDESKAERWADKKTGLSHEVWGRACGWFAVAIADMLDYIPKDHKQSGKLLQIETDLLKTVVQYQDVCGKWYQVIDKVGQPGNWLENSCSCLFTYAIAKAVRKSWLPQDYIRYAVKGFDGITASLSQSDDGNLQINDICVGTCIDDGDYLHYINRPICTNDLHGTGAFVLMCSEMSLLTSISPHAL